MTVKRVIFLPTSALFVSVEGIASGKYPTPDPWFVEKITKPYSHKPQHFVSFWYE